MNLKTSSIPAGLSVILLISSTFFANWAQRRASHVGRFKATQELKENPEQLVYISKRKTDTIEDEDVELETKQKTSDKTKNFLFTTHPLNFFTMIYICLKHK